MSEMNLCPCGKDVTNKMYQFHKYRCPKMEKQKGVGGKVADAPKRSRPSITNAENRMVNDAPRGSRPSITGGDDSYTSIRSLKLSWTNMIWRCLGWSDAKVRDGKTESHASPNKEEADSVRDTTTTSSKRAASLTLWYRFRKYFLPPVAHGNNKSSKPSSCTDSESENKNRTSMWGKIWDLLAWVTGRSKQEMTKPENRITKKRKVKKRKQTLETKPRFSSCRSKQVTQIEKGAKVEKTTSTNSKERKIIDTKELDEIVERMHTEGVIKRSQCPENDVKVFFEKEVKLPQSEITTVKERVKMLSEKIMGKLNLETNLEGWEISNAGSSSDGTKVSHLDEMDCIMFPRVSNRMKAVFDETCVPGFCKVKVEGCVEGTDVGLFSDGDFLNSRKFKHYVFTKLESIVAGDRLLKDARTYPETLSFAIKYTAIPTETGMLSVDVDFVPSIHIKAWPRPQHARDITKVLEDKKKAQGIRRLGFNATPKHCTSGSIETKDLLWQVSFSYAEKQITKYGDKCWKPVMRTLKRVLDIAKSDVESSSIIQMVQIKKAAEYARRSLSLNRLSLRLTTYHVRTLMWTLRYDLTLGGHVWTKNTQAKRLRSTLQAFQKMMTGEAIFPHFFLPAVRNIMDGISDKERKYLYIVAKATEIIFSDE